MRLEAMLDNFDPAVRRKSLKALHDGIRSFQIGFRDPKPAVNMHCHTFFSYNCYGYSPTHYAWLARKAGLEVAGIVDFDVIDGLDEFTAAGRLIGLKTSVGMESRVFVPEFASKVINSPGEPGVAYHMGVGITTTDVSRKSREFLRTIRKSVEARNRSLVQRVNKYLKPVELDYDDDIVPLTPAGNPTERHICLAYARKAAELFRTSRELSQFWCDKLSETPANLDLPSGAKLQGLIRAKTMKQGGPGYVLPDNGSFPRMADMNQFVLDVGAIPTLTWLDGTSAGEQDMEELIRIAVSSGVAALNIIPDRNYKPGVKDKKLQNLYDVVALAQKHGFPITVGTEMNSPGQKFADAFETAEMAPIASECIKGARIVYAHSVLQDHAGMGYLSPWAGSHFDKVQDKNDFFEEAGRKVKASLKPLSAEIADTASPAEVMAKI